MLWVSDPMHGNTETTQEGIKTRSFDKIVSELEQSFEVHGRRDSVLGGVHFEFTGRTSLNALEAPVSSPRRG